MHERGQLEVEILVEGIELLWPVEGDDGDLAAVFNRDTMFVGHDGGVSGQLSAEVGEG